MPKSKRNRYPGVYQRGKSWAFRAQFGDGADRRGVSGSGYASARDAWEARNKAIDEAERAHAGGQAPVAKDATLAEYLDAWVSDHTRTLRPSSADAYRNRVDTISRLPGAQKKVRSMTETDYRALVGEIRGDGAAHATVIGKLRVLRLALNAAVAAGTIPSNPLDRIKVSRTEERFEAKAWDSDTVRKFLAHRRLAGDPLTIVWYLAIVTGLRRGELHGLRREDLDLDRAVLHVRRQRSAIRGRVNETAPKTASSEAPVDLDATTVFLLREHTWTSEYLVTDPRTGQPYRRIGTFYEDFRKACSAAGVPVIRFHDLRHTSAGLLAEAGVPLHQAQQRLRHWSPEMTRHYQRAAGTAGLADAAEKIGALLHG